MAPPYNRSPAPKFIIGACLVLIGVMLGLEQLGVPQAYHLLRFWPAALIVLGLAMLQRTDKHSTWRALILNWGRYVALEQHAGGS